MPVKDSRMEIIQGNSYVETMKQEHYKRLQTDPVYKKDDDYIMNDNLLRVINKASWDATMNEAYSDENPRYKLDFNCAEKFGILIQRDMDLWKQSGHGNLIEQDFGLIANRAAKTAFMVKEPSAEQIRFAVSILQDHTEFGAHLKKWKEKEMDPKWLKQSHESTPISPSRKNRFYGALNKVIVQPIKKISRAMAAAWKAASQEYTAHHEKEHDDKKKPAPINRRGMKQKGFDL